MAARKAIGDFNDDRLGPEVRSRLFEDEFEAVVENDTAETGDREASCFGVAPLEEEEHEGNGEDGDDNFSVAQASDHEHELIGYRIAKLMNPQEDLGVEIIFHARSLRDKSSILTQIYAIC